MAVGTKQRFLQAEKHLHTGNWPEAITHYESVLRKRPDDVNALAGCAEAYFHKGEFVESERLLSKANRLKPDNLRVLVGLGRMHAHRKEYKKALQSLQSALKRDPNCALAMMQSASIFIATFQPQKAIPILNRALKIEPNNMAIMQSLGDACQQMGQWNQAVTAYESARQHGSENEELLYNLATVYRAVGRFENAQSTYQKILNHQPNMIEAQAGLAELYETTGKTNEAECLIKKFLESNTSHTAPFGNVVTRLARKSGKVTSAITFMQNALNETSLTREQQSQLLFQLGYLLEQNKNYDEAFTAYRKANDLFPASFDAAGYNQFIDNLISTYNTTNLSRLPKSTNPSTLPVFIVGMPRSGTSLVEQIIAAHPNAYAAGELDFLSRLITSLPNLLNSRQPYPQLMDSVTEQILNTLANQYLESLKKIIGENHDRNQYDRITDKMPHNFTHLGFISLLFPAAKIIHCTRNPVDTCFSCYATSLSATHSYATNLNNLVIAYRAYQKLMNHWESVINPANLLEVQYESLTTNPDPTIKIIIDFLDLPWNDACLRFHENKRIILTASQDQANQPIYTKSINRAANFKNHLQPLINNL